MFAKFTLFSNGSTAVSWPIFILLYFRAKLEGGILEVDMNTQINEILDSTHDTVAFRLSPRVFVIRNPVTPITPLGFVHVYKSELGKIDCGLRYILAFFQSLVGVVNNPVNTHTKSGT